MAAKPTVLVVDDEPAIRKMIAEVLGLEGYPTLTAANGREALGVLKSSSSSPRVILLDLAMPEMDGAEFLHELEAQSSERAKYKIILVSAFLGLPKYQNLKAEGQLQKPFTTDQLLNIVESVGVPA